jgi:beta-glucosidase
VQVDEKLAAVYEQWCEQNPVVLDAPWGQWPYFHPEMPLRDDQVVTAANRNDVAVVVIGRAAGEDRESVLEPGSYYLTGEEESLLSQVTSSFAHTVVIVDGGNVMDMAWVDTYPIDAVLLAWAGGMEGARAIADVLTGAAEPGGRLTDTIARTYQDYPSSAHFGDPEANDYVEDVFVGYRYFETFAKDAVLFPFGYGQGYTTFTITSDEVGPEPDSSATSTSPERPRIVLETGRGTPDVVRVPVTVRNTGKRAGSTVVQVYVQAPDGSLAKPARELAAFARTPELEPGGQHRLWLEVPLAHLASYDDSGASGHKSAWVLEPGEYVFHVGADVRSAQRAGSVSLGTLRVIEQLEEVAAVRPEHAFERLTLIRGTDGNPQQGHETVPTRTVDLARRILDRLPAAIERSPDAPGEIAFRDVACGKADLDAFIAQLSPEELSCLAYGDITMDSPLGAPGNAGALGGVTEQLRSRGIPPAITTDGPSGIRISAYASLLPCGTCLASTWDTEGVQELTALHGQEMIRKGSDILLSPGMNIHRDPLCGRNFEYFSEDPLLTGRSAAAVVLGVQSAGVSACPKHFAANNQETNRTQADSRVSERALREIYLKGFEICVKQAHPKNLMTSYNRINGVWGHYHYDLVTTVLRDEWGYEGNVMTDWWMQMKPDPDFPALRDSAYRVRAQVDVLMPGSIVHHGNEREDAVLESYRAPEGGLTLGEMQRTARNVLRFLLTTGKVAAPTAG